MSILGAMIGTGASFPPFTRHVLIGGESSDFHAALGYGHPSLGSIDNRAFAPLSTNINFIGAISYGIVGDWQFQLILDGEVQNRGWSALVANGLTYSRASAGFTTSGGFSYWSWSIQTDPGWSQGATRAVTFR